MAGGDLDAAAAELGRAMAIAYELEPRNRFLLAVLHCTRAELRLLGGDARDAVRDAARAIAHIIGGGGEHINPYLLGMSILMEVRALLALGRVDDARYAAEAALHRLGDRVPQARSLILSDVAAALREAGRSDEAYDMVSRGIALEREALQEFSRLQLGLGRAKLEMAAARRQADALALKNRQLETAIAELAETREQLRELVDRDPLTGLHNRRFLARARGRGRGEQVSYAIADIDHFKTINDLYGHLVGDRVLVRVAELFVTHLRVQDVVMRIGGEEFALLMPGTTPDEAAAACERLRVVVAEEDWERIAADLGVTASFGVASGTDLVTLERIADDRLYEAKRAGRNRIAA
jgi:diguanylate cyclase (GGDEF)-like protein